MEQLTWLFHILFVINLCRYIKGNTRSQGNGRFYLCRFFALVINIPRLTTKTTDAITKNTPSITKMCKVITKLLTKRKK